MIPLRVYRYRDPAAVAIGLRELRKRGLTARGLVFVALDPRGETHIAVLENLDAVTKVRVGDKLSLRPPWDGRMFHFDAIHRLPGDTVLWNGDRRLNDTGSASQVATVIALWLKGASAKNVFLGCTPHQPASWWAKTNRSPVVGLHAMGFVDTVVTASGLLSRRIGDPCLFHLDYADLARKGPLAGWGRVFASDVGNVLLIERRIINYRLVLTCERGLVEIDVSGLPDRAVKTAQVVVPAGVGVVGRINGGAFAVTRGRAEPWGLADVEAAILIGSTNWDLLALAAALNGPQSSARGPASAPLRTSAHR